MTTTIDSDPIKEFFAGNDSGNKGYISESDFRAFYVGACNDPKRIDVVWSNLFCHHYRTNLKCFSDEDEDEKVETNSLPRYLLSTNQSYFEALFSLLDFGGNLAEEAWELINRLPTSQGFFAKITKLEGVKEGESNWEQILDPNSSHKLLYSLYIIEYLMQSGGSDSNKELNQYLTQDD